MPLRVVLNARSVLEQIWINNCIAAASFTFLYYDYFLTLPLESSRFWNSSRVTLASVLFYMNRYISLFGHFPVMAQYFWTSSDPDRLKISFSCNQFIHFKKTISHSRFLRCITLSTFHQYLAVVVQIMVGVLLILRTYALYGCRKSILVVLCVAGLSVLIFGIYCVMNGKSNTYTASDLPLRGCLLPVGEELSRRLSSAWTGMLCFDIMIFAMTLYKSVTCRHDTGSNIPYVILRDGTAYFFIIMVACSSVIISFRYSPTYEKGATTILTNVLSSQILSRLQLNIRDPRLLNPSHRAERGTNTTTFQMYTIFTSIIRTSVGHQLTRTQQEALPMDTFHERSCTHSKH